jgi:hypothetical protein
MKDFAKISFLLISLFSFLTANSQCSPNNQIPKGAILPEVIKTGYVNELYNEIIYYRAPDDTTAVTPLGTFPVRIDSMEITKVEGLPVGFNYVCNTLNCRFNGGEAGCLTLTGTASNTGTYPIKVFIRTYATVKTTFADIPQTQDDINEKYVLNINGSVGMNASLLKETILVYPNPAKESLMIINPTHLSTMIQIFDVTGKLVVNSAFHEKITINTLTFARGLYTLKLTMAGETQLRKVIC